ncbi:MAG: sulfotransferase [Thermodesulfovibrionales bacterium]|nr:sulfotransferase [Thermodesulfovibrionales bacterium]
MRYLYVVGMFRSGTTMLARAMDAHEKVVFASDPYLELLKCIRNRNLEVVGHEVSDPRAPFSDNFLAAPEVKRNLRDTFASITLGDTDIKTIRQRIAEYTEDFSPMIIKYLEKLHPGTVAEVFDICMEILQDAYPKEGASVTGFKEVWTEEFIEPLLTLPDRDVRCVCIVRDPRAVISSKKKTTPTDGNYPLLFMVRQWRKSAAYAVINQKFADSGRYLRVRYEDLVTEPETWFRKICDFIEIPFSPSLLDPSGFRDGAGGDWSQNSSYGTSRTINPEYMDKWKEVLDEDEIYAIEALCAPEMKYLGYEPTVADATCGRLFSIREDEESFSEWIRKYEFRLDDESIREELTRGYILDNPGMPWSSELLDLFFISEKVFDKLKCQ